MKRSLPLLFFLLFTCILDAQNTTIEQLKDKIAHTTADTAKINLYLSVAIKYYKVNIDSSILYSKNAVALAEKLKNKDLIFKSNDILGYSYIKKGEVKKAMPYLTRAYNLGKSITINDQYFYNLFHLLTCYMQAKNSDSAIYYLNMAYAKSLTYSNKSIECNCYADYGEYYRSFSDYNKAVEYFFKSLSCNEKNSDHDKKLDFTSYIGLGNIYFTSEKMQEAIEYYNKALQSTYAKEIAGESDLSVLYNNLAAVYYTEGNNKNDSVMRNKGISYFQKILDQNIRSGNKISQGRSYGNLGAVYANEGKYAIAKPYFEKALEIAVEVNNKLSEAKNCDNLAELYIKLNDSAKAVEYFNRAESIARKAKLKEILILIYEKIDDFYYTKKNYKLAYEYQQKYIAVKDSLLNEQNQTKLATLKTQYETDKKDQQIQLLAKDKLLQELFIDKQEGELMEQRSEAIQQSYRIKILNDEKRFNLVLLESEKLEKEKKLRENELLTKQNSLSKKAIKQQKIITGLVAIGLFATLVVIVLVFRQYRQKQKANIIITQQKEEVEKQKAIVEEKQKEILDSIQYAKRIQISLMPTEKYIEKHLSREKK